MGLQFLNVFQTLVREDRMPIRFGFTHYFGFQSNEDPSAFYMRLGDMAGLEPITFGRLASVSATSIPVRR